MRDSNFKQALAELEPKWAHFKHNQIYQWAWEFLRRNPAYIQAMADLDNEVEKQTKEHKEFLLKKSQNKLLKHSSSVSLNPSQTIKSIKAEEIAIKYGLTILLSSDCDMAKDVYWSYKLAGKAHSDFRLEHAFDSKKRTVKNLQLFPEEDLLIINYGTHQQVYIDQIKKMYERKEKLEEPPQYHIEKFSEYLKMYDLRKWGEEKGRKVKRQGKYTSCIPWPQIGAYLSPKTPYSTNRLKKRMAKVEDFIHGGYMELLKHKGTIKR